MGNRQEGQTRRRSGLALSTGGMETGTQPPAGNVTGGAGGCGHFNTPIEIRPSQMSRKNANSNLGFPHFSEKAGNLIF